MILLDIEVEPRVGQINMTEQAHFQMRKNALEKDKNIEPYDSGVHTLGTSPLPQS